MRHKIKDSLSLTENSSWLLLLRTPALRILPQVVVIPANKYETSASQRIFKDSQKKEVQWLTRWKPTKYFYSMNVNQTRVSLGTRENYPYDWFIGGVDSCQGDSGGPLWRNIKVKPSINI